METAALIFLTGYLGYQIANSKENLRNVSEKDLGPDDMPSYEKPNSLNIYNSNKTQAIDDELLQMSINQYKKAEDPSLTGVLPPIFNSYAIVGDNSLALKDILSKQPSTQVLSEMNHTNKYIDFAKKPEPPLEKRPMFNSAYNTELAQDFSNFGSGPKTNVETSLLTGLPIDRDHQNMVPFFGGSVKQNIEQYANVATLDNYTGTTDTFIHKQEQTPQFERVKQDINPITLNIETDRYIPSRFKQNERPFEQERITAPIADTLDNPIYDAAASFPTIDQLRTGNNPQISYSAPLKSAQYGSVRGTQAKFVKNQPDTHFKLGTDRLFTDVNRSKDRATYNFSNLQSTDRSNQNLEYYGNAASKESLKTEPRYTSIDNSNEMNVFVQPSTRQTLSNDYTRNIKQATTTNNSNYNRDSINLPELERNSTNTMHSVNVNKSGSGGKIGILDDIRGTTKETMLYGDKSGHINSVIRQSDTILADIGLSDYNFKTTQKEMMVDQNYIGQPMKNDQTGYTVNKYNAKTTHKETTSDNYYQGSGKGKNNEMIYSTYMNPEKVRNAIHSINYKGNASNSMTQEENRDQYNNAEINDDKEKLISNGRPNGPQSFDKSGSVEILGETSHKPNKDLLYAHIENIQNTNSNIPTKIEMGAVTHTAHNTYGEDENTRETREFTRIIENQLKDNPFYNLRTQ